MTKVVIAEGRSRARRMSGETRVLRLLLGLVAAMLLLAGCREKLPYTVAGVALPDLADSPGKVTTSPPTPQGVAESLTFNPAKLDLHEEYVEWLAEKEWSRLAETQEVTVIRTVMTKEGKQLILTFSPSTGLVISGTRPAPK